MRPMADTITLNADGSLNVSDEPIIPFIRGDGTGVDIWPAAQLVMDAAAAKHGKKIAWKEVLAGQRAFDETGEWLPDATVEAFRDQLIGIKGPSPRRSAVASAASTWPAPDPRPLRVPAARALVPGRAEPVKHPRRSTW